MSLDPSLTTNEPTAVPGQADEIGALTVRIAAIEAATPDARLDVLEGQTLDGRLDTLEGQTLDARLDVLEGNTLDARLDVLEGQGLDTRLDTIEGQNLQSRLAIIEAQTLDARVDIIEGQTLDSRLTIIEDATLDARVDVLEGQNLDTRLDTLEAQTLDTRLDVLEAQTLDTRLDVLEGQNLQSRIGVLEGYDTDDRLDALEALTISSRLTALEAAHTAQGVILADHDARIAALEGESVASAYRFIYVATDGDDGDSGDFDSPLLTFQAAIDAVLQLKEDGLHNRPIRVIFRAGTYRLTEALSFTDLDSGTEQDPITYEAYLDEEVIITSNELVEGAWTTHSGSIKYIDLPGHADFRSLIVNGIPAVRARTPNVGSYYTMGSYASPSEDNTYDFFYAAPADLPTIGSGETIEVNALTAWRHIRCFISEIEGSGTPRMVNVSGGPNLSGSVGFNFRSDYGRYWLENSLSFLTQAGEFYWNNTTKRLYYWPRSGETLGTTDVEIPTLTTMIEATGETNSITYPHQYATYSCRFKTDYTHADATWEKVLIDTLVGSGTPNVGIRMSLLKTGGNQGMALIRLGFGVTNYFPTSTAGLNDDDWHTFTCSVNIATDLVTMYIDGAIVGSASAISSGITFGSLPPTIGSSNPVSSGLYWDGEISDVVILDKEATADDATALHAQEYENLTEYMLAFFPLDEDFSDLSGNLGSVFSELLYGTSTATHHNPSLTGTSALFNGTSDFISANSGFFGEGGLVMTPAAYINFKNLILTGTDWNLLLTGHWTQEAGYNPLEEPGIKLLRCSHITFDGCTITNFGGVGILSDNSEFITVDGCEISQSGNSCIVLNGPAGVVADDNASGHTISNNNIHDYGRIDVGAHGVCGIAVGNTTVEHNDITDGSFQAVRFRGRLDSLKFQGRNNHVIWNRIDNVVRELNDGAAIYFSGRQPGSTASYNHITNVGITALHRSGDEEIRGLYLDEGASGITLSYNIVDGCECPLLLHQANNCEVFNNVFVNCERAPEFSRYGDANLFGDGTTSVYAKSNWIHANVFGETTDGVSAWMYWADASYNTTIGGIAGEFDFNAYEDNVFTERLAGVSTSRNLAYMRTNYSIDEDSVAGVDLLIQSDLMPRNDSPAYGVGFERFSLAEAGVES